jgi:hypothetical protein
MAVAVKPTPLLSALLLAAPAFALGPQDPFTPPQAGPRAAELAAPCVGCVAAPPAQESQEGLAGLRLAGSGSAALIDGRWWPLGSQPRGARLVSIQRHQVQLRHPDGRLQVLALNPAATLTSRKAVP